MVTSGRVRSDRYLMNTDLQSGVLRIYLSIQSAKMNGHDAYAYLKDVLTRLPTHLNGWIG